MKVNDEIQPLISDFERIKQVADNGSAFWSARDLCTALWDTARTRNSKGSSKKHKRPQAPKV